LASNHFSHSSFFNKLFTLNESNHEWLVGKGKGKAIPLQAWRDPEGSRRLRFPDFKTVDIRRW
jgi:hypothetical protein